LLIEFATRAGFPRPLPDRDIRHAAKNWRDRITHVAV